MIKAAFLSGSYIPNAVLGQLQDSPAIGDVLEPENLPFTFDTLGWKILLSLAFVLLLIIIYKRVNSYRKDKYRRSAIKSLQSLQYEKSKSQKKVIQLNVILKQVALKAYGRDHVAALYGKEWFSFLDSKVKKRNFVDYSNMIILAIYEDKEVDASSMNAIFDLSKKWINGHT